PQVRPAETAGAAGAPAPAHARARLLVCAPRLPRALAPARRGGCRRLRDRGRGVLLTQRRRPAGWADDVDDPARRRDPGALELLAVVEVRDVGIRRRRRIVDDHLAAVAAEAFDHDEVAVRALDRAVELVRRERDRGDE